MKTGKNYNVIPYEKMLKILRFLRKFSKFKIDFCVLSTIDTAVEQLRCRSADFLISGKADAP